LGLLKGRLIKKWVLAAVLVLATGQNGPVILLQAASGITSWYCKFFDNEISDGNIYGIGSNGATSSGESILAVQGLMKAPNRAPLARGMVLRRNKLLSNAHIQLKGGNDVTAAGVSDVIVENNLVENSNIGVKMDKGLLNFI
jgi:hypothetical protein